MEPMQDSNAVAAEYCSYADAFNALSVVNAYRYRPPYPIEVFDILTDLMTGEPRCVLDVGCGRGDIARPLVAYVERLDAVDLSQQMIERGKQLPNGNHPRLRWLHERIETVELEPPYALITAALSIHWMDWSVVMPRFQQLLGEGAYLAIVETQTIPDPWSPLQDILPRFQTARYQSPPSDPDREKLFQKIGECITSPISFMQSIDEYIESFHSRPGFSRERMGPSSVDAFKQEAREVLQRSYPTGMITFQVVGHVIWGFPQNRSL